MDREQFDALAKLVWTRTARRTALGALFGTALLGFAPAPLVAKGKHKRHHRRKRHKHRKHRRCYPGTSCTPGAGQDNAGCDFARSLAFFGLDAQGADLSQTNLTRGEMAGANLSAANLSAACLVGANLLGAAIDAATNLDGAIYCRTLMPDGSFNDQDCGQGSQCCPAPVSCQGDQCPATCIGAPNAQCSLNVPYGGCCPGLRCVPSSTQPIVTTCQAPCSEDSSCRARFGTPYYCASELAICRYLGGQCCQHV